jgi:hypothetical protein
MLHRIRKQMTSQKQTNKQKLWKNKGHKSYVNCAIYFQITLYMYLLNSKPLKYGHLWD